MIKQSFRYAMAAVAIGVAGVGITGVPADAKKAGTQIFQGNIVHMTPNNIKVMDPVSKQTLSFLLVPHFDQVFAGDNKTTYQEKNLHNGQFVKVYYDQKLLGTRHADRILVLTNSNMVKAKQKG